MPRKRKQEGTEEPTGPTFEAALARVEEIAARLESDALSLEEAISLAEEGQRLLQVCEKHLTEAEGRIRRLVERSGKVTLEPLEVEEAQSEETA